MIKIKIGKTKGESGQRSFGLASLGLEKKHKDLTLEDLAWHIGERLDLRNGYIELHSIEFNYLNQKHIGRKPTPKKIKDR